MMNGFNAKQLNATPPAWTRPEMVFVITSAALLSAFFIPLPEIILDILWGFVFCLAGAAMFICLGAENSSDLGGFVPVVSGLTLLRLFVLSASARRTIEGQTTGILVPVFGRLLAGSRPLGAVLVCLLLAVICVIIIFASCQKIAAAAKNYIQHILPLKKMGLETDMQMGLINEKNAGTLLQRIVSEFRFFAGMNGSSLLMRSEAAICIFILLSCLILPGVNQQLEAASGIDFINQTAPAVLALSLFTLLPSVIVAMACGALLNKETLTLRTEYRQEKKPVSKKIALMNPDTGDTDEIELLNPECLDRPDTDSRIVEFEPEADLPSSPTVPSFQESLTQQQTMAAYAEANAVTNSHITSDDLLPDADDLFYEPAQIDLSCDNTTAYYEAVCDLICKLEDQPCVAVLASDQIHSLPATVAVNVAILLAQQRPNVLLVDCDIQRNAIAQIFETDPEQLRQQIVPSCLEMLSLHGVAPDKIESFLHDRQGFQEYATTLIVMPDITGLNSDMSISVKPDIFYFSQNDHQPPQSLRFGRLNIVPDIQSIMGQRV